MIYGLPLFFRGFFFPKIPTTKNCKIYGFTLQKYEFLLKYKCKYELRKRKEEKSAVRRSFKVIMTEKKGMII